MASSLSNLHSSKMSAKLKGKSQNLKSNMFRMPKWYKSMHKTFSHDWSSLLTLLYAIIIKKYDQEVISRVDGGQLGQIILLLT